LEDAQNHKYKKENKIAMDRKSVPKKKIKLRISCEEVERHNIHNLSQGRIKLFGALRQ